jgi:hypothetical protein
MHRNKMKFISGKARNGNLHERFQVSVQKKLCPC